MKRLAIALAVVMAGCRGEAPHPIWVYSRAEVDPKCKETSARLLEVALEKIQRSEFVEALDDIEEAERLDPENVRVREVADEVRRILWRPRGSSEAVTDWLQSPKIRISKETRLGIRILVLTGEGRLRAGNAEGALRAFSEAESQMQWLLFTDQELTDFLFRAKEGNATAADILAAEPIPERN